MLLQIWGKVKLDSQCPNISRREGGGWEEDRWGNIVVNCIQAVESKTESREGSQPREERTPKSSAHWPKKMSNSDPGTEE